MNDLHFFSSPHRLDALQPLLVRSLHILEDIQAGLAAAAARVPLRDLAVHHV